MAGERQETVHVVLKEYFQFNGVYGTKVTLAVKVFDDRADARSYAKRMDERTKAGVRYKVQSCKKG